MESKIVRKIHLAVKGVIGKSWTLYADHGESRGTVGLWGYATEAKSGRTHEFKWGRRKVKEEFRDRLNQHPAPNYVRLEVAKLMKKLASL